jgi:glycosyltransferase involved in cell wall biosynthesis
VETTPEKAGLVVYRKAARVDAIDEYSRRLVNALCDSGVPTRYVADGLSAARRQVADPRWLLIQYNPFSYGPWGVAPGLIREVFAFRRRTDVPVAVSVHEAWVDTDDRGRARWRSSLMGTYQHAQLVSLLRLADVVIAATQALVHKIGHRATHVPVGSNVPPLPITRDDARQRLDLGDEIVVSLFGGGHPSRALEYATAAIELLSEARGPGAVKVLNLGLGAPQLNFPREIAVETPGHLAADDLSVRLCASDIMLLPFTDGLSTRRTTLMAGLAHGLPVVGLYGPGTDDVLMNSPEALTLTPVGDIGTFAHATLQLANDPHRLRTRGESGRELYARYFDWPVTARQVAAAMNSVGRRGSDPARR